PAPAQLFAVPNVHLVDAAATPSACPAPEFPAPTSATSHVFSAGRHVASLPFLALHDALPIFPEQWSFASSSHAPPVDVPNVQLVDAAATPSPGHAAEVPAQPSPTSHAFSAGRHVVSLPL